MNHLEAPQFPAGEYVDPGDYGLDQCLDLIGQLEEFPGRLHSAVAGLSDARLELKYRNWSVRQIVHHVADSHINCYVRFKWSLTESNPVIKSYDESLWSKVIDARESPIDTSLTILQGIHGRWGQLLRRMSDQDFQKGFFHPELDATVTLKAALPSYVWHGDHHLAQIKWVQENRLGS